MPSGHGNIDSMIIHAYHGWGSDASIWDQVVRSMDSNVTFRRYDRGYFGPVQDLPYDEPADLILTHSMGLLFVPNKALAAARRMVVVNGFGFFPSSEPKSQRRNLALLTLMKTNLQRSPVDQVLAFCTKAGMKVPASHTVSVNANRLMTDLDLLATRRFDVGITGTRASMLFLHATDDPIVCESSISETVTDFPNAEHHYVTTRSHNLPDDEAGLLRTLIFGR